MADIKGTTGKDIYTVKKGDNYDALDGDDELTFEKGGTVQPGPGNDKITVPVGLFFGDDASDWHRKDSCGGYDVVAAVAA